MPTIRRATSRIRPTYSTVPWPRRAGCASNRPLAASAASRSRATTSAMQNLLGSFQPGWPPAAHERRTQCDERAARQRIESAPMSERQQEGAEETRGERLELAIDAARRRAEEQATAEIHALEQDLERERERAARSLEALERRLEDAEARAQKTEQELAAEDARRSQRERQLLEQSRAELEVRIRKELEDEMAERIAQIKSEADARASEEISAAREAAEARYKSQLRSREEPLQRDRAAAQEAAEAAQRRFDEITEQIEAAGARVEGAE